MKIKQKEKKKGEKKEAREKLKELLEPFDISVDGFLRIDIPLEVDNPALLWQMSRLLRNLGYNTLRIDDPDGTRRLCKIEEDKTRELAHFRLTEDYLLERLENLEMKIESGYYGESHARSQIEYELNNADKTSLKLTNELISSIEGFLSTRHNYIALREDLFYNGNKEKRMKKKRILKKLKGIMRQIMKSELV